MVHQVIKYVFRMHIINQSNEYIYLPVVAKPRRMRAAGAVEKVRGDIDDATAPAGFTSMTSGNPYTTALYPT
jgi:hypothetical protein